MNFQQYPFQNPLDSMNYNFQNMNLQNSSGQPIIPDNGSQHNTPTFDTSNMNTPTQRNRLPLSRTTSLMDSIGIQRTSSPFMQHPPQNVNGIQHVIIQPGAISGWGTPQLNNSASLVSDDGSHQYSVPMDTSMSNQSIMFGRSAAATPVHSSATNLFAQHSPLAHIGTPLAAAESQWKYIDTMGQIQGPFESSKMNTWLASGYFPLNLQVVRMNTSPESLGITDKFVTVTDIINFSNDYRNPFTSLDQIIASEGNKINCNLHNMNPPTTSIPINASSFFSSITNGVVTNKPIECTLSMGKDYSHNEILKLKTDDGGYYQETVVQIPVGRRYKEKLDPNTVLPQPKPKEEIKKVEQKLVKSVTPEILEAKTSMKETQASKQAEVLFQKFANVSEQRIEKAEKTEKIRKVENKEEKVILKKKSQQERIMKQNEIHQSLLEAEEDKREEGLSKNSNTEFFARSKLNLAPWANKINKVEPVTIPIEDLKKKTTSKKQEEQKLLAEMRLKQQQYAEAGIIEEPIILQSVSNLAPWANKVNIIEPVIIPPIDELKKKSSSKRQSNLEQLASMKWQDDVFTEEMKVKKLKSMLTWASKTTQEPVFSSIDPIVKKKSQSFKKVEETPLVSWNQFEDRTFIKEQEKIWAEVQRTPKSASGLSIGEGSGNAWTTVSTKPTKPSSATSQSKIVNQPSSYISPDKLRAIGGSTPIASSNKSKQIGSSTINPLLKTKPSIQPVTYPGNASISVRQELIKWCKAQLKLDSGIQSNSALEILFSLPAGIESTEIIADTINSNSSSMNGKRFATEFITKRVECEKQITDPLSWMEALSLPEGNDDDWEFQVVSKKKGRRY